MTERQAQAAWSYRSSLIEQGLSMDRVNVLLKRYADKKITERSRTIARTETMAALNKGTLESYLEAQRQGYLSKDSTKEWIITPDERLCPICGKLEGVNVPMTKPFPGGFQHPPAHPRCRCTVGLVSPKEKK